MVDLNIALSAADMPSDAGSEVMGGGGGGGRRKRRHLLHSSLSPHLPHPSARTAGWPAPNVQTTMRRRIMTQRNRQRHVQQARSLERGRERKRENRPLQNSNKGESESRVKTLREEGSIHAFHANVSTRYLKIVIVGHMINCNKGNFPDHRHQLQQQTATGHMSRSSSKLRRWPALGMTGFT